MPPFNNADLKKKGHHDADPTCNVTSKKDHRVANPLLSALLRVVNKKLVIASQKKNIEIKHHLTLLKMKNEILHLRKI